MAIKRLKLLKLMRWDHYLDITRAFVWGIIGGFCFMDAGSLTLIGQRIVFIWSGFKVS